MNRRALPTAAFGVILTLAGLLPAGEPGPAKVLPLAGELFVAGGHPAFVIPASSVGTPAPGPQPWVWYAPTLPRYPDNSERWMFERFTAAGLAVAGIDVGESYGSPAGRAGFEALYAELVGRRGWSPRPVLLGRSRGGLQTLAWAADHPDRVAGWAGIYPVCDLRSYPGLAKAAPAFGLDPGALEAALETHNPISRLGPIAARRVPLLAIHGDADLLVPLAANSAELRRRYEALGGRMELIVPSGQGHSLWPGFFQSEALVAFVVRQAGVPVTSR